MAYFLNSQASYTFDQFLIRQQRAQATSVIKDLEERKRTQHRKCCVENVNINAQRGIYLRR